MIARPIQTTLSSRAAKPRCRVLILTLALAAACRPGATRSSADDGSAPTLTTTVLTGPEGGLEAFEPALAIDPRNPDRIMVAAMYGNPMARGGRAIWVWDTDDGGTSWNGRRMTPPLVNGEEAGWAADVSAAFEPDGSSLLTTMAGAFAPRAQGLGGIAVSRRAPGDTAFGPGTLVMQDRPIEGTDHRAVSYDKPWMVVDTGSASPHRGTVYVVSGVLDFPLPVTSWADTPPDLATIVMLGLDLAVSQDGGRTFGPARRIADSVFGAEMTVSPDGALHVVYPKVEAGSSSIVELRSTDGGQTFQAPETAVSGSAPAILVAPLVAVRPDGELMTCWSAQTGGDPAAAVRCGLRSPAAAWADAAQLAVPIPRTTTVTLTRLAGTARAWYLLATLIDSTGTSVALFRSDGRSDFARLATLATIPGLDLSRWCFDRQCRTHRTDLLMAGDYSGLAAGGGRIAAAYVLPRPGEPLAGSAAVYLSVLSEP